MARKSPNKHGRDFARKAEMDRLRYLRNKEERKLHQQQYRESLTGRVVEMYHSSKRTAQQRGLSHTITKEWLHDELARGTCEVTGLRMDFSIGRSPYSPSIDRIDSSKGYSPDNCRIILWAMNCAFHNWGEEVTQSIVEAWLENKAL